MTPDTPLPQPDSARRDDAQQGDGARFRRLMELSSDWYWEQDEQFRFKDVGSISETHLRAGPAAYVGSTRWDNPNTDLTPAQWAAHRAVLEAHQPFRDFEYGRVSRDGQLRYMSVCGEPAFDADGRFRGYCGIAKDITAQRQAGAARAQLQQLLNSIIEEMPTAVQLKTLHDGFRIVMWNKASERLFGVPREEAIGRTMHDLWPAADADRMLAADRDLVAQGGIQDFPDRTALSRHHGTIRVHMRKVLLRDAAGAPTHILVIADDITARLDDQARLRDSEARFRSLTALSSDWYWEQDADLRFTQMSGTLFNKGNFRINAAIGKTRRELPIILGEAEWAAHKAVVDAHLPFAGFEYKITDKDGHLRAYTASGEPLFDGEGRFTGYRGVASDITERKLREEDLQRLHVAMGATTDGIYLVDRANLRFVYVNAAASRMLGRPHDDIIALGPTGVLGIARAELERIYDDLIAANAPAAPVEMQRRRPDGTQVWVELRRHAQRTEQGWMIITVARDISAAKQVEAARAALELELRESQKMEAIGTLAGGIAHDFNNIISAILGNVELARQDVVDPRARESLEEIRKAGFRARSMVQQILTFSRRQPTQRVPVALPSVVEESVRLLRATLPARVEIAWRCDAQAPAVLADATQLQQVLINLGTNAAYAIGARAGSIDIEVAPALLDDAALRALPRLGELRPGRFARITVRDTGQGMDATTLEHIFEPFFTTKPVGEGTGLGLSVAHGILRAHDGAVLAHSEPGQGSRFDLYLPAAEAAIAAPVAAPPAAAAAGIGQRVLYVDDDESLLFLTQRMLGRRGYRVTAHAAPDAALAAVRADPHGFDLVVTDFNMPGKSGLDVARAVREIRPDLPVAITSGYITDQLRAEAEGAGVRALIFKPNAVEELCDAVQRLILTPGADSAKPSGK
jgi:PAS domain S-box-containing protein